MRALSNSIGDLSDVDGGRAGATGVDGTNTAPDGLDFATAGGGDGPSSEEVQMIAIQGGRNNSDGGGADSDANVEAALKTMNMVAQPTVGNVQHTGTADNGEDSESGSEHDALFNIPQEGPVTPQQPQESPQSPQ